MRAGVVGDHRPHENERPAIGDPVEARRDGHNILAAAAREFGAVLRVEIDDTIPGRVVAEQPRLGFEIALHAAVIVEVVSTQIGEQHRIECHAIDTLLRQCVR